MRPIWRTECAWYRAWSYSGSELSTPQAEYGRRQPGPTVTAGGLVFIGATNDGRFRAIDSKTGKELWSTKLERNANANPMTYAGKNGKQYVAVIATDTVSAFSLP